MAFSKATRLFARVFGALPHRWLLSDPAILLLGALLGTGLGLFFLRDYFFGHGLAAFWDYMWPYQTLQSPQPYLWNEFTQSPVMPNIVLMYLLPSCLPREVGERLLFLIIFAIMGLSMFFATFKLTSSRHTSARIPLIVAGVATVFFIANPVVAFRLMHPYDLWLYMFLPLLFWYAYSAFKDLASRRTGGIVKKSIPVALVLFLMSPSGQMPFYFPFLALGFFIGLSRPYINYLKKSVILAVFILAFAALFHAVLIVPIAYGSPTAPQFPVFSHLSMACDSKNNHLSDIFALKNPDLWGPLNLHWWGLNTRHLPYWHAALIMTPVIAFSALIFRRNKLTIWLVVFALAFIFLAKGINPPFGGFYSWMTWDAPVLSSFGWQFRTPPKWLMPAACCYYLLVGLTLSYFLGWLRGMLKRVRLRKILFPASVMLSVAVLVTTAMFSGYPFLSGDLCGHMQPRVRGSGQPAIEQFMLNDSSDCNVVYYRTIPSFHLPKPATPRDWRFGGETQPLGFKFIHNSLGNTTGLGKLLSPWNVHYVVVQDYEYPSHNASAALSLVSKQGDLEYVGYYDNNSHVYKYTPDTAQIEVAAQTAVVAGGLENMLSLAAVDSYDPLRCPVVFLDQKIGNGNHIPNADIVISNQDNLDLYMTLLEEEDTVAPFDWVDYGKAYCLKGTVEDYVLGEWHSWMEGVGLVNRQYDYGKNFVRSADGNMPNMSFQVDDSALYDILVRHFQNIEGTETKVWVDGELVGSAPAKGQVIEFAWHKVGTINLQKGKHTLSCKVGGINTVNLLAVLRHGELERYEEQVDDALADERVVYIWEAETALNRSGIDVSAYRSGITNVSAWKNMVYQYGVEASNGRVLNMPAGSYAGREIEILKSGYYRAAIRLAGSAVVDIDGQVFTADSSELGLSYLNPTYLEKGRHTISVSPAGSGLCQLDVIWLYSTEQEGETLQDVFIHEARPAEVVSYQKVNPTKYCATVNASGPFMLEFAERYNPLWVARVNGKEYPSIPVNSIANGFWIEEVGTLDITIEYKIQGAFFYGGIVTGISIAGALAFLMGSWVRDKRRRTPLS